MRLIAGLLMLTAFNAAHAEESQRGWRTIAPGLELYSGQYQHREPYQMASVLAIRIDQRRYRLAVANLLRQSKTAPTLRSLASDGNILVALNGSYVTSYAFPQPLGFVRIGRVDVSTFNKGKLLSGMICIDDKAVARLAAARDVTGRECTDALQSGPMLVEETAKNGINPSEPSTRVFDRSVVCIDEKSRILFITAQKTALYDLAEFLRRRASDGGLGCQSAINLSGDADSGVFWREAGTLKSQGTLDASGATALIVKSR